MDGVHREVSRSGWDYDSSFESLVGIDAAILLPTLNEEKGLARTLDDIPFEEIRKNGWNALPVVIDGGSTDRTREVARERGIPVIRQQSRGKGAAVLEGLEGLKWAKVPYAVVLDADATYPGQAILPALNLLLSGTDLVIGLRRPTAPSQPTPPTVRDLVHRAGNVLLNMAAEIVTGCALLDICSGFYAVPVAKTLDLGLVSTGFAIEAELFIKARRSGWTVRQFPVAYGERVGEAKLHALRDGLRILNAIRRFGRQSVSFDGTPAVQALSHLLRELTTIMLIDGPRDLILLAPPERRIEAAAVAHLLRTSRLAPRVEVDSRQWPGTAHEPYEPSGAYPHTRSMAIVRMWDRWDETPIGPADSPVAVRYRPGSRNIFIDVQPPMPSTSNAVANHLSQSGAFMAEPSEELPRFLRPVRFLAQRILSNPLPPASTMLRANGFRVELLSGPAMSRSRRDPGIAARRTDAPPASPFDSLSGPHMPQ